MLTSQAYDRIWRAALTKAIVWSCALVLVLFGFTWQWFAAFAAINAVEAVYMIRRYNTRVRASWP